MNNKYYILMALNLSNNQEYYISNTNPLVFDINKYKAKRYLTSKNAEFDILRDYDNYNQIKQALQNNVISELWILEIINEFEDKGRIRIL